MPHIMCATRITCFTASITISTGSITIFAAVCRCLPLFAYSIPNQTSIFEGLTGWPCSLTAPNSIRRDSNDQELALPFQTHPTITSVIPSSVKILPHLYVYASHTFTYTHHIAKWYQMKIHPVTSWLCQRAKKAGNERSLLQSTFWSRQVSNFVT